MSPIQHHLCNFFPFRLASYDKDEGETALYFVEKGAAFGNSV